MCARVCVFQCGGGPMSYRRTRIKGLGFSADFKRGLCYVNHALCELAE